MDKYRSLYFRFMSHASYNQKYCLAMALFFVSYLPLCYFTIQEQRELIEQTDRQIIGVKLQEPLQEILKYLPQLQILQGASDKILEGKEEQIKHFEQKLDSAFQSLKSNAPIYQQALLGQVLVESGSLPFPRPEEMANNYESLKKAARDGALERQNLLHEQLLAKTYALLEITASKLLISLHVDMTVHELFELLNHELPEMERFLISATAVDKEIISGKAKEEELANLRVLTSLLSATVLKTKEVLQKIEAESKAPGAKKNLKAVAKYHFQDDLRPITQFADLLKSERNDATNAQFIPKAEDALRGTGTLWDDTLNLTLDLLDAKRNSLILEGILSLVLPLPFVITALFLGYFLIRSTAKQVHALHEATQKIAEGKLDTRVLVFYHDEVGSVGISFNKMATSLQRIIHQLKSLIEATQKLTRGDFNARVEVTNTADEIGQVGLSFNNMVQSFEDIIGQLQELGIHLTASANEISNASKEQEAMILEQEATTREIAVTANEISDTAKEFAITVKEVTDVAEKTSKLATAGKDSLTQMERIMHSMVESCSRIGNRLVVLSNKAKNISLIIVSITKIADQTNLLSLNASIEAEKAGEFGKSFAVIAREIRRLADQTAIATLNIEKMVEEITAAVARSVQGVDEFTADIKNGALHVRIVGEQLSKIIEQVHVLTDHFELVNQGMQAQSTGAEQINNAIRQLNQTAQHSSESIHQFRNTLQHLNLSANDLKVAISKIKMPTPYGTL